MGLKNYHVDKFGAVAGIRVVSPEEDIILISSDGIVIRTPAEEIRQCARPSKGVRVMKVQEDSKVVTLTSAPKEEASAGEEMAGEETEELPAETAESTEGIGSAETEAENNTQAQDASTQPEDQ